MITSPKYRSSPQGTDSALPDTTETLPSPKTDGVDILDSLNATTNTAHRDTAAVTAQPTPASGGAALSAAVMPGTAASAAAWAAAGGAGDSSAAADAKGERISVLGPVPAAQLDGALHCWVSVRNGA